MYVLLVVLVDRVVREMHECLLVVGFRRCLVLRCAEASQTFVAKESLDWVEAKDAHVHPEIKLEAIQEERSIQIPLNDDFLVVKHVRQVLHLLEEAD